MSRFPRLWATCLVGLALAAPIAYAREGGARVRGREGAQGRHRTMRGTEGETEGGPGGGRGALTGPLGPMGEGRVFNMPLAASEKARAELQRHRAALAELMKSVEELRTEVKKAGEEGKEAAIKENLEKAKALAARIIAEYATHVANMGKIVEEEGAAVVDRLADIILQEKPGRAGQWQPRRTEGMPRGGKGVKKLKGGEKKPPNPVQD